MEVYADIWDTLITKLQQLGFSPNGARVYLTLVGGRPMNGSEIAKVLGINRSLIYKALEELSCKGAITGLPVASTTRYTALPLEEILDGMRKDFESTCEFLRNQLGEPIQMPEMKNIWNVSGYGSVVRRASLMLQKAVNVVQIAGKGQEIELFRAGLSRAARRGLKVEKITPGDEGMADSFPLLLLVDHRELLAGYIGRPGAPGQLEMPVIWTENPGIVRMAEVVFSFAHGIFRLNNLKRKARIAS